MTDTSMPERIGPYTIDREIGRGGMGVVYLGHDPRLDRAVAINEVVGNLNRPKKVNGGGNHDRADKGDRHGDGQGADDGFPCHDQTLRVRTRCLRTAR